LEIHDRVFPDYGLTFVPAPFDLPSHLEKQRMDVDLFLESAAIDCSFRTIRFRDGFFVREMLDQLFQVTPETAFVDWTSVGHGRLRK
jgi:hypothetical protein